MRRSALVPIASFIGLVIAFSPARASSLIVPDQIPTIQAAIDAVVDTIIVRPGTYDETLVTRQQFSLMTSSEGADALLPVITGIQFHSSGPFLYECRRLRFNTPVGLNEIGLDLSFVDCEMPGINEEYGSTNTYTSSLSLLRCRFTDAVLNVRGDVVVDSCQFAGILIRGAYSVVVRGCTVQGPGRGIGAECRFAFIEGNVIRGTRFGVRLDCDNSTAVDNVIEDCQESGIYDWGLFKKTILGNTIRRCANGIELEDGAPFVSGNIITESGADGIFLLTGGDFVGNVITKSRGSGIHLSGGGGIRIKDNTIAMNGGSGIYVEDPHYSDECSGNIVSGNAAGASWEVDPNAVFKCNDWYGNRYGDVRDRELFETEFSVDPEFCDSENGDFRLRPNSPLLDWPGCGRVGALGACDITATLVRRFDAERVSDGIRVVWEIAPGATDSEVWLERTVVGSELWIRPTTERSADGTANVELDRNAAPDLVYRYRLTAREGMDGTVIGAEITVEALARSGFALLAVSPSPGSGPARISFSLAHSAPIQVDVFDLQGRCLASPARGVWPTGSHEVEWNGLTRADRTARPGLYLVRYTFPGGRHTRRLIRIP